MAIWKSLEHNRSLKMMEKIDEVVKWSDIEALLMERYEVGTSAEGADAYPPLMLLLPARRAASSPEGKAFCSRSVSDLEGEARNGFRIPSDPELENQINDRISFKKFLGLTLDKPSPLRAVGPMGRRLTTRHSQGSEADYLRKP